MAFKTQYTKSHKIIILVVIIFIFLCILRQRLSDFSYPQSKSLPETFWQNPQPLEKVPPFIIDTLVHYATANRTPQQTFEEISLTSRVLKNRGPCNFLIFGLGFDSLLWKSMNYNGRTVFLEEDSEWIAKVKVMGHSLEIYQAEYSTQVHEAVKLFHNGMKDEECKRVRDPRYSNCRLAIKNLPKVIYENEWDLIMVDAPKSWSKEKPGRMSVIYTAGLMARNRDPGGKTDIFIHDAERWVENKFSRAFLCEGYIQEQVGMLRHFAIPSHRTAYSLPFCP